MAQLHFEDVNVGDQLPPFQRKTDIMHWNRFAAVNDEFVYIHMDEEVGALVGEGGAFGMGNLRWAYVMNMIRGWAGDDAEIREVSMQFRAVNHKYDVLTTNGRVTAKEIEEGRHVVRLDVGVFNQDGKQTAPGTAIVVLPSRDAGRTGWQAPGVIQNDPGHGGRDSNSG